MRAALKISVGLVAAAVLVIGCDNKVEDNNQFLDADRLPNEVLIDTVDGKRVITYRAVDGNGINFNGINFNGLNFNSLNFNSLNFNGINFNGINFNSAEDGSEVLMEGAGDEFFDYDLNEVATDIQLEVDDKGRMTILKSNGTRKKAGANDEVTISFEVGEEKFRLAISEFEDVTELSHYYMRVQYQHDSERALGTWHDTCFDSSNTPIKAMLLPAGWDSTTGEPLVDPTERTWACRGSALAKAVEWGYPLDTIHDGSLLDAFHQTLTRVIRADYCYNGNPHTVDGTAIDYQDKLGINVHETDWPIEAVWGENGVLCLNDPRRLTWSHGDIEAECGSIPRCDAADAPDWEALDYHFITRATPL